MLLKLMTLVVTMWAALFLWTKIDALNAPYMKWLKKQSKTKKAMMAWIFRVVFFAPVIYTVYYAMYAGITFFANKSNSLSTVAEAADFGMAVGLILGMGICALLVMIVHILTLISRDDREERRERARRLRLYEVKRS